MPEMPQAIQERDVASLLEERIRRLEGFLLQNCPQCFDEQRHLDEGSNERVYWHYGSLCALRDALKLIRRADQSSAVQRGQV